MNNINTQIIYNIALEERNKVINKYNTIIGKCIEVSDNITNRLLDIGIKAKEKQVWCLYEQFENCMEVCYEEHWLSRIIFGDRTIYIDATMDQFQWAFSKILPQVYIDNKLPNFLLENKPDKNILIKCGWIEWYNTGSYINNFNYWG